MFPAFWSAPQACMTHESFTAMQAIVSTPFAFRSSALTTRPGMCVFEQPGVNAPGTANSTTLTFPEELTGARRLGHAIVTGDGDAHVRGLGLPLERSRSLAAAPIR